VLTRSLSAVCIFLFPFIWSIAHESSVFGLPPDIVGAALGGLGVQQVADLENLIPDNIIQGVDECLQRCGIERVGQPTAQRQPRVSANAFPAGIEPSNIFELPAATASSFPVFRVAATSTASSAKPSSTKSASKSASTSESESVEKRRVAELVERAPYPEVTQFSLRR
jgi:hypothetical protein